jgi:hypothetical protein
VTSTKVTSTTEWVSSTGKEGAATTGIRVNSYKWRPTCGTVEEVTVQRKGEKKQLQVTPNVKAQNSYK